MRDIIVGWPSRQVVMMGERKTDRQTTRSGVSCTRVGRTSAAHRRQPIIRKKNKLNSASDNSEINLQFREEESKQYKADST